MSDNSKILKRIVNSAVIKNPLLFEAIGLCPVVAIALTLRLSVFLAIVTAIEMIVCEVLASLLLKNVRRYWRVALYVIFGVAVIIPIMILTNRFSPEMSMNFGIYLPLMAVNSLIALHCERVAVKNNVRDSLIDATSASLSYGAVAIIVGFTREILSYGSLGGVDLNLPVKFPALATPFGGLIIIGFLAAALKSFVMKKYPDKSPDRAFDTSEIRRSLRGSFRELMKDDFNPYDEGNEAEVAFIRVRKERKLKAEETEFQTKEVKVEKEKSAGAVIEKKYEEKPHKEKKIKEKKSKIKKQPEAPRRERTRTEGERTYLDDFSDMLTELEDYKNRTESTENKDADGGDEQ